MALLAAVAWIGAWAGCIRLKDDGMAASDAEAAAVEEGADVRSGDAGAEGDPDADAQPAGILWPNDVPVCWYSLVDEAAFESTVGGQAHWIHDTVESNWGHEADLRFGAWPLCPSSDDTGLYPKVLILPATEAGDGGDGDGGDADDAEALIARWGGEVDGIGAGTGSLPTEPPKITFLPLVANGIDTSAEESSFCATNRIFSRVLGLADDPAAEPFGAIYCGDVSDPVGNRLSPLQILRARQAYGPKPTGSVVAFDGRCLTAQGLSAGSLVKTDACVPQASGAASSPQRWTYDPWAGSLSLVEGGLVLDALGAAQGMQPEVRLPVANDPDQAWSTSAAAIRGIGGTCLDFQNATDGDLRTVLWTCGLVTATQRVDFGPDASIRATSAAADASATCLVVTDGVAVGPASCDGTMSQQWKLAPGGAIESLGVSGACLEAAIDPTNPEVGLEDGIALRVAPCSGTMAQQFDIFGVLLPYAMPTMCLDVQAYVRADGTVIWTYGCGVTAGVLGGYNQWWDIHW